MFFDNLVVNHRTGPLLEETHYYPFGLTMAGISSKAAKPGEYPENKKKYNGIEKEDGLGIEMYDAQLRELDPQTGRWWQIDPKIENMEMWSPYASNYDNPITYSDPLGDEGEGCCNLLDIVKLGGTLVAGAVNSWSSNQIGGAGRVDVNKSNLSFEHKVAAKTGQMLGDGFSIVTGTAEMGIGGGGALISGGTSAPVSVPLILHGASSAGLGLYNLIDGFFTPIQGNSDGGNSSKVPNPEGSKGKPDHQNKVKELNNKAQQEAGKGEQVIQERKIQGHDSNRRPDVQIVDPNGKTRKFFEAERKPQSQRNKNREAEYKKLGVEQETHPVKKP